MTDTHEDHKSSVSWRQKRKVVCKALLEGKNKLVVRLNDIGEVDNAGRHLKAVNEVDVQLEKLQTQVQNEKEEDRDCQKRKRDGKRNGKCDYY